MSGETPEVGDKASWNWNGSAPSGHVAEKKDEGEVSVQSKRGNTIKKAAQPDDPAVHLSRPGNDVVKNQSELNVEEKKADGGAGEKEEGHNKEAATNGEPESAKTGEKRKAGDEAEDDGEPEAKKPKARGRPKGSASTTPAKKVEQKEPAKKRGRPSAADKPAAPAAAEKKSVGRPKKEGGATPKAKKDTKAKKTEKAKTPATGIGKRTRSGGK